MQEIVDQVLEVRKSHPLEEAAQPTQRRAPPTQAADSFPSLRWVPSGGAGVC